MTNPSGAEKIWTPRPRKPNDLGSDSKITPYKHGTLGKSCNSSMPVLLVSQNEGVAQWVIVRIPGNRDRKALLCWHLT